MSRDEFALWLKDPVTKWVMTGVAQAQAQEKAEWDRVSWGNGVADPVVLAELRTRALALGELVDNDYETWSLWNGEDISDD